MKRGAPLRRRGWIKRKTGIKQTNPERIARRKAKYDAFMQSPEWRAIRKAAIERAGKRCEQRLWEIIQTPYSRSWARCRATTRLTVHHKTYARFGGRELPEDLQCLCKAHHDLLEGQLRPWNKKRATG